MEIGATSALWLARILLMSKTRFWHFVEGKPAKLDRNRGLLRYDIDRYTRRRDMIDIRFGGKERWTSHIAAAEGV
jgi:hypothetical protein